MDKIGKHLSEVGEAMTLLDRNSVDVACLALKMAKAKSASVYLVGNGGSAATCAHFANDLVKMCHIKAYSLADMTPLVTAHGNDDGWKYMFSHSLHNLMHEDDVIVAISYSGNSDNVVEALGLGVIRILMTGPSGLSAAVKKLPDVVIHAMTDEITVGEDIHSIVCHAIARRLMER